LSSSSLLFSLSGESLLESYWPLRKIHMHQGLQVLPSLAALVVSPRKTQMIQVHSQKTQTFINRSMEWPTLLLAAYLQTVELRWVGVGTALDFTHWSHLFSLEDVIYDIQIMSQLTKVLTLDCSIFWYTNGLSTESPTLWLWLQCYRLGGMSLFVWCWDMVDPYLRFSWKLSSKLKSTCKYIWETTFLRRIMARPILVSGMSSSKPFRLMGQTTLLASPLETSSC
jgi:hypothetical protein